VRRCATAVAMSVGAESVCRRCASAFSGSSSSSPTGRYCCSSLSYGPQQSLAGGADPEQYWRCGAGTGPRDRSPVAAGPAADSMRQALPLLPPVAYWPNPSLRIASRASSMIAPAATVPARHAGQAADQRRPHRWRVPTEPGMMAPAMSAAARTWVSRAAVRVNSYLVQAAARNRSARSRCPRPGSTADRRADSLRCRVAARCGAHRSRSFSSRGQNGRTRGAPRPEPLLADLSDGNNLVFH
jgi:hypothetical protein